MLRRIRTWSINNTNPTVSHSSKLILTVTSSVRTMHSLAGRCYSRHGTFCTLKRKQSKITCSDGGSGECTSVVSVTDFCTLIREKYRKKNGELRTISRDRKRGSGASMLTSIWAPVRRLMSAYILCLDPVKSSKSIWSFCFRPSEDEQQFHFDAPRPKLWNTYSNDVAATAGSHTVAFIHFGRCFTKTSTKYEIHEIKLLLYECAIHCTQCTQQMREYGVGDYEILMVSADLHGAGFGGHRCHRRRLGPKIFCSAVFSYLLYDLALRYEWVIHTCVFCCNERCHLNFIASDEPPSTANEPSVFCIFLFSMGREPGASIPIFRFGFGTPKGQRWTIAKANRAQFVGCIFLASHHQRTNVLLQKYVWVAHRRDV